MDSFEEDFTRAIREKTFPDPWAVCIGRTEEILDSCAVVEELAKSYLACKPIDVFGTKKEGN
jgi:hypothetical protein